MYLDVTVEDLDSATHTATALGARTAEHQASPDQWRVLLDPAVPFPPYRGPTDLVPTRFRRPSGEPVFGIRVVAALVESGHQLPSKQGKSALPD